MAEKLYTGSEWRENMAVLSVLDLSPINEGGTVAEALNNSRLLAQHTEALGYHRYWVAEHHNICLLYTSDAADE